MSSSLVGASAALTISGVPFMGPIGGCRVGCIDGEFVLNPKQDELENSTLDLIVAGTPRRRADGRVRSPGIGRRHDVEVRSPLATSRAKR